MLFCKDLCYFVSTYQLQRRCGLVCVGGRPCVQCYRTMLHVTGTCPFDAQPTHRFLVLPPPIPNPHLPEHPLQGQVRIEWLEGIWTLFQLPRSKIRSSDSVHISAHLASNAHTKEVRWLPQIFLQFTCCVTHNPLLMVNRILRRRNFIELSCVADVSERNATGIQYRIIL